MKNKKQPESRDLLSEDARTASSMGLTYGKYKALTYTPSPIPPTEEKVLQCPKNKPRKRKYTDQQLFDLWQQGLTDPQIAATVGVTKGVIYKWRDLMEVPASMVGRDQYRLVETEFGLYVVHIDDLI